MPRIWASFECILDIQIQSRFRWLSHTLEEFGCITNQKPITHQVIESPRDKIPETPRMLIVQLQSEFIIDLQLCSCAMMSRTMDNVRKASLDHENIIGPHVIKLKIIPN